VPSLGPLSRAVDPQQMPRIHAAVYAQTAVWPADVATLGKPFLVRDRRGVALHLHPVRWNPERGQLEALVRLTLNVETTGQGGDNVATTAVPTAGKAFAPVHDAIFGAAADKSAREEVQGHGYGDSERMLIISGDSYANAAANLASWKRERGYDVEIVTMSDLGGNLLGMKETISQYYFSEQGLAYLILVGDVDTVPTNFGNYQGADSDGMFGLLSGDDLYVDILISRLPARSAGEARLMIDRVLAYERDPHTMADRFDVAAGIASDEGSPADYERAEELRDHLLAGDYTDVARIYQGFGGDRDDIAAAVNDGLGLINYLGHGDGTAWLSVPFGNSDVHALTNTDAWPVIVDVSCSNGDFSRDECFAEAWLRSAHDGQPAGAVAMISASTATSWVPPCVMQAAMIDQLASGSEYELGALYAAGVAAVLVQYEGLPQADKLMEQYNLFGDCSLLMRTRTPEILAVQHDAALPAGTVAIEGAAPAGSRVVLSDNQTVLARTEVAADGEIRLVTARPLVEGESVWLTVTAINGRTYRVLLPVQAAPTAIDEALPAVADLLGNWPNPFNPATAVAFVLPGDGPVRLSIHDARGRLVRVLVNETLSAGHHEVTWNGRDQQGRPVASGVYLARLQTAQTSDVLKVTMAK
jgi:gingipain R